MLNKLDQKVIYYKKSSTNRTFDYQEIDCEKCNRKLKIAQIQRKNINQCLDFAIFIYYCFKCRTTIYIFKFINKKEDLNNGKRNE